MLQDIHLSVALVEVLVLGIPVRTATVWAATKNVMITAGHVCEWVEENDGVLVVNKKPARILKRDDENDICSFAVISHGLKPLKIAKEEPKRGSEVWINGCPLEVCEITTMGYVGGYEEHWRIVSAPSAAGSSGSPILNRNGEVVGIVSSGPDEFVHINYSPPLKAIQNILK
jgi:S1-C subfamily serine protease